MAQAQRILMLAPQLGYGGAERSFIRIANYLSRHRQVTVALFSASYGGADYADEAPDLHCPVILLDEGAPAGRLGRWRRRINRFRALKVEHDVSISFLSGPNLVNALTSRAGLTVVSERGSKRFDHGTDARARVANRILDPQIYRRADAIVAVSRGVAAEIREGQSKAVAQKVVAIEGGIVADELIAAAREKVDPGYTVLADFRTVAAIGRLHPTKGFDKLIGFFADVRDNDDRARLLLVGDGPMKAELIARAQSHGLSTSDGTPDPVKPQDVVFAGYRSQPTRFLSLARVFAFTSVTEGLGNVLIEALAAGISILAADCPYGPRSVLTDGEIESHFFGDRRPCYPEAIDAGVLLPPVDSAAAGRLWPEVLRAALSATPCARDPTVVPDRLARFDIERTGMIWLDLCDRLRSKIA